MNAERRHFRIELGYDGTDFFGSQRQREMRTVQSVVEAAICKLGGEEVSISLAGRTDRGVHAVGQVASASLKWRRDEESLRFALDVLTANDVSVRSVCEVGPRFHARFDAREREYRYRIWNGSAPSVFSRRFAWHVRDQLDVASMNDAAAMLLGRLDFSSFAGAGIGLPSGSTDCTRDLTYARWAVLDQVWERNSTEERLLEFRVRADRFLPHMVRNIVGNLVAVGRGSKSVDWFAKVLATRDRRCAGASAPPQGLTLWSVTYGAET